MSDKTLDTLLVRHRLPADESANVRELVALLLEMESHDVLAQIGKDNVRYHQRCAELKKSELNTKLHEASHNERVVLHAWFEAYIVHLRALVNI